MTTNSYGDIVFDGVCTDVSNAAYPVDRVRRLVEPCVRERDVDVAVHLGLSLVHEGVLEPDGNGAYRLAVDEDAAVDRTCELLDVRVVESGKGRDDFAEFARLVGAVIDGMTR